MLRCVRKEGKVFFRLQLKILISSTSKHLNGRVRIYYKVWTEFIKNGSAVFTKVVVQVY
jgi:archaeosine-15-forming tRNA-guanine transglycosylase